MDEEQIQTMDMLGDIQQTFLFTLLLCLGVILLVCLFCGLLPQITLKTVTSVSMMSFLYYTRSLEDRRRL